MVSRHLTRRTSPRGGAFHGLFPAPCPVPFRARLRQQIKVAIDLGIWDGSRTSAAHGALYIYTNNLVLIQSTLFPSYRINESIIALYRYNYKEIGGNCVRGDFCSISDPRPLFSLKCRTLSASTPNHDQTRRWMSALALFCFYLSPSGRIFRGRFCSLYTDPDPASSHENLSLCTSNADQCRRARVGRQWKIH